MEYDLSRSIRPPTRYQIQDFLKGMTNGFSMRQFLGPPPREDPIVISELRKTEWSFDFEDLQRARLIIGALRYGKLNAPNKPNWDRPSDMIRRIELYIETHNMEHLVDVGNLAMLEFEEGRHPDRHFLSQDNSQHTEKKK